MAKKPTKVLQEAADTAPISVTAKSAVNTPKPDNSRARQLTMGQKKD